jgi:hypothetical protein
LTGRYPAEQSPSFARCRRSFVRRTAGCRTFSASHTVGRDSRNLCKPETASGPERANGRMPDEECINEGRHSHVVISWRQFSSTDTPQSTRPPPDVAIAAAIPRAKSVAVSCSLGFGPNGPPGDPFKFNLRKHQENQCVGACRRCFTGLVAAGSLRILIRRKRPEIDPHFKQFGSRLFLLCSCLYWKLLIKRKLVAGEGFEPSTFGL